MLSFNCLHIGIIRVQTYTNIYMDFVNFPASNGWPPLDGKVVLSLHPAQVDEA